MSLCPSLDACPLDQANGSPGSLRKKRHFLSSKLHGTVASPHGTLVRHHHRAFQYSQLTHPANVYSNGVSEEIIGKAIKKFSIPRDKLTILTKCFGTVGEDPGLRGIKYANELPQLKDYTNHIGLSRTAIFNAVDASLARLDTPYIDLLQIHRFDETVPIEETMEALHDLVKSGKVRYIGASSMWAVQFASMQFVAEKNGWTKFVSMQNHYNLLYREEEREMNRFCNMTGVGLIPVCLPLPSQLLLRADVCLSGLPFAAVTSRVPPQPLAPRNARRARRRLLSSRPDTQRQTTRLFRGWKSLRISMAGR